MSAFWSIFVTVVTLVTILACFLLLHLTRRSEPMNGANQQKDHEFDGIRELETPLPRWWYWMFVGSMVLKRPALGLPMPKLTMVIFSAVAACMGRPSPLIGTLCFSAKVLTYPEKLTSRIYLLNSSRGIPV